MFVDVQDIITSKANKLAILAGGTALSKEEKVFLQAFPRFILDVTKESLPLKIYWMSVVGLAMYPSPGGRINISGAELMMRVGKYELHIFREPHPDDQFKHRLPHTFGSIHGGRENPSAYE